VAVCPHARNTDEGTDASDQEPALDLDDTAVDVVQDLVGTVEILLYGIEVAFGLLAAEDA